MKEVIYVLWLCYILLFLFSIYKKDNSIVDIFWWCGFFIVSYYTFFRFGILSLTTIITLSLITLWSFRIVIYIASKKKHAQGEDPRYAKWRLQWKYFYTRSFFQIYLLQALLLLWVALPIFVILFSHRDANIYILLWGSVIALCGLVFETIADIQLSNFIKTKKPWEIYTSWLYRYSRHPNYFWESLFWLGISTISLSFHFIWILWFLLITFLLLFVSGIPLLEKRYESNTAYQQYKKHTSIFIPWFYKN